MLTPEMIQAIESALQKGKRVEIGYKNGKIVVWEIKSTTLCEVAAKGQR